MRGETSIQSELFSYVSLESRIPADHPIRRIRNVVDNALADMNSAFDNMYSITGRPSIPPEQLIRALLLQILFTIRSERQLMERLDYDLMFRWFVGLGMDDKVWHPTVFTKNRDRVMKGNVDELFFDAIKKQAYAKKLMSRDHFSVDGTLLDACASMKSFKPKDSADDDDNENFHGQKRSNKTHESTTDADARLFRKGSAVDGRTTSTDGYAISQVKRKRIEECFGWMKDIGLMRKLHHIGRAKVAWIFRFTAAAYNITRMKTLIAWITLKIARYRKLTAKNRALFTKYLFWCALNKNVSEFFL